MRPFSSHAEFAPLFGAFFRFEEAAMLILQLHYIFITSFRSHAGFGHSYDAFWTNPDAILEP